jgi:DNA polymerase-1
MATKTFLLVDAHALIYRAFFAFPDLSDPNGQLVNAVFGFSRMFLTALGHFEPEYAAVCFDHPSPTFRKEKFQEYKAQRAKMPDTLIPQIQIVKDVVDALNVPRFELAGFEADDLIGTVNRKVEHLDGSLLTVIVTGDKDSFQLIDNDTHVWMPARGKQQGDIEYDSGLLRKRFGIEPIQVIDLKALMGDPSDNIPGVKGIGEKTASTLIQRFGSVEKLYQFLDEHPEGDEQIKGALLQKLLTGKEMAFLSQDLARIDCQVPIDFDLEACRVTSYDKQRAVEIFQQLGFKSLQRLLPADAFEQSVQEALF